MYYTEDQHIVTILYDIIYFKTFYIFSILCNNVTVTVTCDITSLSLN